MMVVLNHSLKSFKNIMITSFWNEFIYGGHFLSVGASALVLTVNIILDKPISIPLLIMAYLIAQIVYMVDHNRGLNNDKETNPERTNYLIKARNIHIILPIVYLIALIILLIIFSNLSTLLFIAALIIFGASYPKNITRNIIGFKNYYVAFLWAASSVTLPYVFYSIKTDSLFYLLFLFIFVRFIISTTFFDLKDMSSDKLEGLKTVPAVIGFKKTLQLLLLYSVMSGMIIIYTINSDIVGPYYISLLFLVLYSFIYILMAFKASKKSLRIISYIMVDGEYIFWPILVILGRLLIR